ncbi:helix-turn-helix transcriptional regulator [Marinomonas posidonica]|uniref:helix-turn-helix transcriptional regulator n=1 Tax=Marinomonas posidonica TaxID=936476 RepID=UPI0037367B22
MTYRVNQNNIISVDQPSNGVKRQRLPAVLGTCYVDRELIEPGIAIAYSSYTASENFVEESRIETSETRLSLTFGLSGQSIYQCKSALTDDLVFSENHATLTTFGNSEGERIYKEGHKIDQLRILISGNAFDRLSIPFPKEAKDVAFPIQQQHTKISQNTIHYLKRLMTLMYSNQPERPLEKHILVLNLLSEQLSLLQANHQEYQPVFHHRDEANIISAKRYMIQNMSLPITLANVCQAVGISESKLKQGTKALYQLSPHQLLLQIRMEKAWEQLMTGSNVSQTAYSVGYQHASNFSAAFNRYYGFSPKSLLVQRQ